MTISKADFDLSNPTVVLRMMCGLFYIPHILFKLNGIDGSVAFFAKAGFSPALGFVVLALVMESVCAVGLTFNLFVKWIGLISAGTMAVAAYAVFATKGVAWLWNFSGVEYLAFWGIASFALAVQAWKKELAAYGRIWVFNPPARAI